MVPDRQNVRADGMDGRTDDAKTISLRLCRGIIMSPRQKGGGYHVFNVEACHFLVFTMSSDFMCSYVHRKPVLQTIWT